MSTQQSVVVRFPGERVCALSDEWGTCTLYRTPEDLYRVHMDKAGGEAWLEPGPEHEGYDIGRAYSVCPELFAELRA